MKIKLWMVFVLVGIILFSGLGFYIGEFRKSSLSGIPQDWGSFGTFMSMCLNACTLTVVGFFSYQVYIYNRRKDAEMKNPILTFKVVSVKDLDTWYIENVGNGAALNLQVCFKIDAKKEWISPLVKCYSLGKGDSIDLDWISNTDVIGVHYKVISGEEFISLIGDDIAEVRLFDGSFTDIIINGYTYDKAYFDKMLQVPPKRLTSVRKDRKLLTTCTSTTSETTRKVS